MRLGCILTAGAVVAGCGAHISGGVDSQAVDAGASVDAAACADRSVYLNFEGQTLRRGPSDATTNTARWLQIPQGTAAPYLAAEATRSETIQRIVDGVRAQLAPLEITVVTTRPPSGPYVMVVLGGTANAVGSRFAGAVNQLDCRDSVLNDVAWISDNVAPLPHVINSVVGAIGFGVGLTATNDPLDCMCGWSNNCQSDDTTACQLGSPIARDPDARQVCAGATTQDEVATLRAAFCR